eukprot:jgi/Botrbrau1/6979/Bobra.0165s0015.1
MARAASLRFLQIALTICLLSWQQCQGEKILFFLVSLPVPCSPHLVMLKVINEMAERGHDVRVVASEAAANKGGAYKLPPNARFISHQVEFPAVELKNFFKLRKLTKYIHPLLFLPMTPSWQAPMGEKILGNETLIQAIKDFGPNILVSEFFDITAKVAAGMLGLPGVAIHSGPPPEPFINSPSVGTGRRYNTFQDPRFVPMALSPYTSPMTLPQQLANLYNYLLLKTFDLLAWQPPTYRLQKKFGVDLASWDNRKVESMVIANLEWALELPRQLPPNVKWVGPLQVEYESKPLPPDLQEYMDQSERGVILVSLGTVLTVPEEQIEAMGRALSRVPADVIWRISSKQMSREAINALNLGSNVKVVDWMPQKDILAHPKLRIFVSHCGHNSVLESAWYGKPIVGVPGMGDQPSNAEKVQNLGWGLAGTSAFEFDENVFHDALHRVLTEPHFAKKAALLSRQMRARKQTPVQEAGDWIEHVAQTGDDPYLHMRDDDMSFLERYGLFLGAHACFGALLIRLGMWVQRRRTPKADRLSPTRRPAGEENSGKAKTF